MFFQVVDINSNKELFISYTHGNTHGMNGKFC